MVGHKLLFLPVLFLRFKKSGPAQNVMNESTLCRKCGNGSLNLPPHDPQETLSISPWPHLTVTAHLASIAPDVSMMYAVMVYTDAPSQYYQVTPEIDLGARRSDGRRMSSISTLARIFTPYLFSVYAPAPRSIHQCINPFGENVTTSMLTSICV